MAGNPSPAREAFAHEAVVRMAPAGDDRAPGGAITLALCGSWTHEPPCPVAPHSTRADRTGTEVSLRVLFAASPADELSVRRLIEAALESGGSDDPDGRRTTWQLVRSASSPLRDDELAHADRLTHS